MLKDPWEKFIKDGGFHFYKKPWSSVGNDSDSGAMNLKGSPSGGALKGENAMLVRDRGTVWIIATFNLGAPMAAKKKGQEHIFRNMGAAISALEAVLEEHDLGEED